MRTMADQLKGVRVRVASTETRNAVVKLTASCGCGFKATAHGAVAVMTQARRHAIETGHEVSFSGRTSFRETT